MGSMHKEATVCRWVTEAGGVEVGQSQRRDSSSSKSTACTSAFPNKLVFCTKTNPCSLDACVHVSTRYSRQHKNRSKQYVRTVVVVQQVYSMTRRGWIVVKVYRVPATNSPRDSVNDLPVPPQSCCSIQYQGYRGAETADSSIVPRVPGGAEMTVFSPAPKVSGGETTGTGRPGTLKACVYVCVRDECVCSAQQETH